jgi:hypothetical protein
MTNTAMKKFFLIILIFGSINVFSQELFVDYLEKVPLNQPIDYVTISKVFQIDTLWKRNMQTRFFLKSKFIDKFPNVNTVILHEENGVGGSAYLYSFTNDGQIIDSRKISEGFDNADLSGPDYDYFYTLENMLVIINYGLMIPVQPTKDEPKSHIIENYYTYINIRKHGYFFELTEKNPPLNKRLFPYVSREGVPIELLRRLTKDDLILMRNEIYASYGYRFKEKKLKAYFGEQEWYEGKLDNVEDKLNRDEKYNIENINEVECR